MPRGTRKVEARVEEEEGGLGKVARSIGAGMVNEGEDGEEEEEGGW